MVVFYKWKKKNEIELRKNKIDLNNTKIKKSSTIPCVTEKEKKIFNLIAIIIVLILLRGRYLNDSTVNF